MGIADELRGHSDYVAQRTLARLEGLTDDELRWQPVPGAWTIRQLRDGRVVIDNCYRPVGAPAVTSIAWRLAHLTDVYGSPRNARWLRRTAQTASESWSAWRIAGSADASVAQLTDAMASFDALLASADDDLLWERIGSIGGPFADSTLAAFVLHQIDEATHHGAEVGILRDLYCDRSRSLGDEPEVTAGSLRREKDGVARAADLGRWDIVEELVDAGSDVNATSTGRTALHQAAAIGDLQLVRLLVDHGAEVSPLDPDFRSTAEAWARQFGQLHVAEYLAQVGGDETRRGL
ncbi:MAG TPA: DinB family protein [Acidimicrobiales bacterium]|nr:DinB family protein [Acidimicrobiales bacterium]